MYRHCAPVDERPVISDNASAGDTSKIDNNEIKAWPDERQMETIARGKPRRAEESWDRFTAFLSKERNTRDKKTLEPTKKSCNNKYFF